MAVSQKQAIGPLRGSDGQVFDLAEASVAKKKSRVPEIALGVLLVAGCALAALAWQTIADPSRSVLAVSANVSRGDVISANNLQVVEIASNDIINVIPAEQSGTVIGQIAQVDLSPGTLLTANMVADVVSVEPGQALVGMTVPRGALPSSTLRIGSPVDVIVTPSNSNDESFATDAASAILVRNARIAEISVGSDRVILSLTVAEGDAPALARAIAAERVRLVAVPEDRSSAPAPAEAEPTADTGDAEEAEDAEDGQ